MHPVIAMKTWAHAHHMFAEHEAEHRLTQWIHGDRFWPVVAIVLALAFMFLLVYMGVRFNPESMSKVQTSSYTYPYWIH